VSQALARCTAVLLCLSRAGSGAGTSRERNGPGTRQGAETGLARQCGGGRSEAARSSHLQLLVERGVQGARHLQAAVQRLSRQALPALRVLLRGERGGGGGVSLFCRRKAEVKKTGGAVIPLSDVLNVFSLADDSVVHRN
jgi:hypothetical protein